MVTLRRGGRRCARCADDRDCRPAATRSAPAVSGPSLGRALRRCWTDCTWPSRVRLRPPQGRPQRGDPEIIGERNPGELAIPSYRLSGDRDAPRGRDIAQAGAQRVALGSWDLHTVPNTPRSRRRLMGGQHRAPVVMEDAELPGPRRDRLDGLLGGGAGVAPPGIRAPSSGPSSWATLV